MATIKPLLDYLPEFMRSYDELQKIMTAEQTQMDEAWDDVGSVWKNQYLFEADSRGVARLEKEFDIVPKITDTLDERKFRIFTLLNQELPYTYNKLVETLTALCGSDWSIDIDSNSYTIDVKLGISNHNNMQATKELIEKMVPANMVATITLLHNQHSLLANFTHAELEEYTHEQLRNEVLDV